MNNNFLAKWLNTEISDEELKSLVGETEFDIYNKIKFDSEAMLKRIKSKTTKPKAKVISLIPNWAYSAAATVALLLAAYLFIFSDTTLSTNYGQQSAFNLEDGSYVILNAKSTLSYNKRSWSKSRSVNLNGEAYFEVQNGNSFTVNTDMGSVKVLGTHFNVKTAKDYFKVTCFEGKVSVLINNKETILTQGQTYQFAKNTEFNWDVKPTKPSWLNGLNTYQNTPLFIILNDLENQFKIDIDTSNIDINILLNASFDNQNVDLALRAILVPLNFNFIIKNKKVTVFKK